MNIDRELLNIEKNIIMKFNVFKAIQGTEKTYINMENDFKNIEKKIDQIKAVCLTEKRGSIYRKYCEVLQLYIVTKNKIENINRSNEYIKQNNIQKHEKIEENKEDKCTEKLYMCQDQSQVQIKKMNKDYNEDDYNFTNPPPLINRYQVNRIVETIMGKVLIRNEVFSYPINMEKMEQDEKYRSNVLNKLLTKKNIKEAIENYGGNVTDSLKGNYIDIDEYTLILSHNQMEKAYNFYREDNSRICLLPVGTIQIIENNKKINQYRYCSFNKENANIHIGYIYGNIDIVHMEKDDEYKKDILDKLNHEDLSQSKYIGEINENLQLEEDGKTCVVLQQLGFVNDYKEIQEILDL